MYTAHFLISICVLLTVFVIHAKIIKLTIILLQKKYILIEKLKVKIIK